MVRLSLYSVLSAVLLLSACGDTTGSDTHWNATEPDMCVLYFEGSFNDRKIEILETQIAPGFVFHFAQSDIGETVNGYTIPSAWDYDHIFRAASNMFRAYGEGGAYFIRMIISEGHIGFPPEGAGTYTSPEDEIYFTAKTSETGGYEIENAIVNFSFVKGNNGTYDYWRLTDWYEFTSGEASIGKALAHFYGVNPL